MAQYSVTLWDAVKFEVLQAQEPELADDALLVLKGIASCLSKSTNSVHSSTSSPLLQYLKPVNKECLEHLHEPAARQAKAAGDILKAVSSASLKSFEAVIKTVGPQLSVIYQSGEGIVHQRAVLEVTNQLFEAAIDVYGSWTSPKSMTGHEDLLNEFKDKLVAIYSQALMGTVKEEVSFRLTAAKGLLLFSKLRGLLADNEIGMFVQYFNEIVLKEESHGRDELKRFAMTALADISRFKPSLISDITFPAFVARLPDNEEHAREAKDYRSVLEGLAEISVEKDLLETFMRRLLNRLDILFQTEGEGPFPYTTAILAAIHYVLRRSTVDGKMDLGAYYDRVVVALSKRCVAASEGPLVDEVVLDMLGRISNLIVRASAMEKKQHAADNVYTLFRQPDGMQATPALLLEPQMPLIVSTWLLASLPKEMRSVVLQQEHFLQLVRDLAAFAPRCRNAAVQRNCLRQISLYVNKHIANQNLSAVDEFFSEQLSMLKAGSAEDASVYQVRLLFTLVKALTLRLAPKTNQYLSDIVGLLESSRYSSEVSKNAALGFGTILADDDVLSKINFAQIRLLAPQRVFQVLTPLISTKFRESQSVGEKENYLVALSGVLGTVPSEIVMPELPILLPLLLQSLDISDQAVKTATLETTAVVIANNPAALVESGHIPALAKRLLTAATLSKQAAAAAAQSLPRTRKLATRCLTLMPRYISGSAAKVNPLLPLKKDVLQGLTKVLDDPKRDVRKEGVDARAAWIRDVDDPVEDDDEEEEE